eukprot:IDg2335t1
MRIAHHEILQRALQFLSSEEAVRHGLHLCINKCNVWWPTPAFEDINDEYPITLKRESGAGHNVLKSPSEAHRFLVEEVERRVEKLKPKFKDIIDINDAQTSFALLRSCMGYA